MQYNQVYKLQGEKLSEIGFSADMVCLSFGELITRENIIGDIQIVGIYTIHVQCVWRFIKKGQIILTYWDLYDVRLENNVDTTNSIFDIINESMPLVVKNIKIDDVGTLQIEFNNDIIFDIFPDRTGKVEHWRFIDNIADEHIVYF